MSSRFRRWRPSPVRLNQSRCRRIPTQAAQRNGIGMATLSDYPLKEEVSAKGKPVEISFFLYTHFGSHDCSTNGDLLNEIVLKDAKVLSPCCGSKDWQVISPGIEIKNTLTYSQSGRQSICSIRIQPSTCPVTLRLNQIYEYSASDYPHEGEHFSERYSIRIID